MADEGQTGEAARSGVSAPNDERQRFVESLKRRGKAAQGLQNDLLTEVPQLYGSPGERMDPGVVLAKIHRDEMVRRNRGGVPVLPAPDAPIVPPLERVVLGLLVLLFVFLLAS